MWKKFTIKWKTILLTLLCYYLKILVWGEREVEGEREGGRKGRCVGRQGRKEGSRKPEAIGNSSVVRTSPITSSLRSTLSKCEKLTKDLKVCFT